MSKIHSKLIVECITCWLNKSLEKFEFLMGDENNEKFSEFMKEMIRDEKNYSTSSKINKKVYKEVEENSNNILKNKNFQDQKKMFNK